MLRQKFNLARKIEWLSRAFILNALLTCILIATVIVFTFRNTEHVNPIERPCNIESAECVLVDEVPKSICDFSDPDSVEDLLKSLQSQMDHLTAQINNCEITTVHCEEASCLPPHLPCGGLSTSIDFLYWKADEDDLEYGSKVTAGQAVAPLADVSTKLLGLHFEWDPGFRLGVAYTFENDYWALDFDWTHIFNRAHGSASSLGTEAEIGNVNTITPLWVILLQQLSNGALSASAHWHVNYNTYDLNLGRSFFLSPKFVLTPFIGARGATINQHYRATYNTVFLLQAGAPTFTQEVTFKAKNDFGGVGPRIGTDLLWHFNQHWNLFTQLSGSLLIGKFRIKMQNLNDQGEQEGEIPPSPYNFFAKENFWRMGLNFEEAIGLSWETFFHCNRYHLSFNVAYQLTQWLNQNQLYYTFYFRGQDTVSSFPVRSDGNLNFHGINVGVQFDF